MMDTAEKIDFIIKNHGKMKNKDIANEVGMSTAWVKLQVTKLLKNKTLQSKIGQTNLVINNVLKKKRDFELDSYYNGEPSSKRKGLHPGLIRHTIIIQEKYLHYIRCLSHHTYESMTHHYGCALFEYLQKNIEKLNLEWDRYSKSIFPLQIEPPWEVFEKTGDSSDQTNK